MHLYVMLMYFDIGFSVRFLFTFCIIHGIDMKNFILNSIFVDFKFFY